VSNLTTQVLHVLLTNRYPNHWTKDSDQPAIQQVLHCDVDSVDSSEQRALHSALADLLTACGSTEGTADEIAILAIESLAIIATVLLNAEKVSTALDVADLAVQRDHYGASFARELGSTAASSVGAFVKIAALPGLD
jgi:hypothetical protein